MKTQYVSGNIVDGSQLNKSTGIHNYDSTIYYNSNGAIGSSTEYINEHKPYGGTSGGGIYSTEIISSISYYAGGEIKQTVEGRSSESKTITTNIYYDGGGTIVSDFNTSSGVWIAGGDAELPFNSITQVWKTGSSMGLGKVSGTTTAFSYTGSITANFLGSDNTAVVFLNLQNSGVSLNLDYKSSGGFMLWLIGSNSVGSNGYYLGGRDTLYPGWNLCWAGSLVADPDLTAGSFQLSGADLHKAGFAFKTLNAGSLITSGNLYLDRFIQRNHNSQTGDITKMEVSVA